MTFALTRREKDILDFIRAYADEHEDQSPSYDEMASALGLKSKSGINRLIMALEERGHITRMANRARTITIIERPTSEYERGWDACVKHYGFLAVSPSGKTPSPLRSTPPDRHCPSVERSPSSGRAFLLPARSAR